MTGIDHGNGMEEEAKVQNETRQPGARRVGFSIKIPQ